MSQKLLRWISSIQRFSDRVWYIPLVSLLALLDFFILVIPTDALVISTSILRPKRWISLFIWVSMGSTLGAVILALLIQIWGNPMITFFAGQNLQSPAWIETQKFIGDYGVIAILGLAVGPLPLQPGIIVATAAGMPLFEMAVASFIGRAIKYAFFSWAATHVPHLLGKFWGIKSAMAQLAPTPPVAHPKIDHSPDN